jgi:peptide/nickel transport system substrate-binding protein
VRDDGIARRVYESAQKKRGGTTMRRAATLAAAALLATLGATASAQTLRIGLAEDPDMLDPTLARTYVGRIVFAGLCDKLFDITPDLKIVPQLASGYSWSDDKKSLEIKLRPGVVFHDGEKLDAAAVKFNIERHLNLPGSVRKGEIAAVKEVEVVDDATLRLNLSNTFAPLLAQLTDRAGMMVSPKAARDAGDKFAQAPVCAGPFKFAERVAQDRIVLEKFDKYWNKDHYHFDKVIYQPIPDAAVRAANLQSGGLDFIERVAPTDYTRLKKGGPIKTAEIVELGYQSINVNVGNGVKAQGPLAKEPKLREAFDLAIDRGAINQVVFEGLVEPGNQWVAPGNPYYVKSLPVRQRDIAKAKQLMKEAGLSNVTLDFMVPNESVTQQAAQVIQSMVAEAGINLNIRATEFASSLNLAEKGDFDLYLINWSGRTDPDGNLYNFLVCKQALNYPGYCNEEVDREVKAGREVEAVPERMKHYEKVAAAVLRDHPIIYLYHRKWLYAHTPKLAGFTPYPDGLVRLTDLQLK